MHVASVMNTRASRLLFIATAVTTLLVFMRAPANAQFPPAQGPAQPSQNALNSCLAQHPQDCIETSAYTFVLEAFANSAIDKGNKSLPIGSLSLAADKPSPYIIQTLNQDRPNEFYVDIPELLTYTYSAGLVSVNFTQSADFSVSCEGWQTGSGTLTVSANVQQVQFDPGQVPAQALPLIQSILQSINSQSVSSMGSSGEFILPAGQACGSLGLTSTTVAGQQDYRVYYDPLPEPDFGRRRGK
jgi:hypothetical protein